MSEPSDPTPGSFHPDASGPEPGTFYRETRTVWGWLHDSWRRLITPRHHEKVHASDDLVERYQQLSTLLKLVPKEIYYPGAGFDASPAEAWPTARTVFADQDPQVARSWKKQRPSAEFQQIDATEVSPDRPIDLLILLNSGLGDLRAAVKTMPVGGYILTNNWHDHASKLTHDPAYAADFSLVGILDRPTIDDEFSFETNDPGKLVPPPRGKGEISRPKGTWAGADATYVFRRTATHLADRDVQDNKPGL